MSAPPGVPACCDTDNPGLFESTEVWAHEKARAYCARCPVVQWCLEERERAKSRGALPVGTWGGLLWLTNGRHLRIEHGTERGYNQHLYRHEKACKPCRYAHLAHNRALDAERARRKEAANA